MKWYQMNADEVEQKLYVTTKHGLAGKQADERLKQYGPNRLESEKVYLNGLFF